MIHCLGPVYVKDKPSGTLLADCYRNALKIAGDKSIESVAFPAISTAAFGYPFGEATEIALKTIWEMIRDLIHGLLIRFVLYGEKDYSVYEEKLEQPGKAQ